MKISPLDCSSSRTTPCGSWGTTTPTSCSPRKVWPTRVPCPREMHSVPRSPCLWQIRHHAGRDARLWLRPAPAAHSRIGLPMFSKTRVPVKRRAGQEAAHNRKKTTLTGMANSPTTASSTVPTGPAGKANPRSRIGWAGMLVLHCPVLRGGAHPRRPGWLPRSGVTPHHRNLARVCRPPPPQCAPRFGAHHWTSVSMGTVRRTRPGS